MCGIAGFIDQSGREQDLLPVLGESLARIVHRGPDGEGRLVRPGVGVYAGMRRLSIIDLEGGHQPIWNEDNSIAVLFNGEIYNYLELRKDLLSRGHQFRTQSDTEVLVHLYEEHGKEMLRQLRGMFGFALFDFSKGRCLIARDHFGQKPLYYSVQPGLLAFGSEIKSLLSHPRVPSVADREAFLDYLSWLRLPAPATHLQGIFRLGPGQLLDVDLKKPDQARCETYWSFQFSQQNQFRSMDDAAEALEGALDESLRLHVRSDVPVGVMLSGGLDSRTIGEFAKAYLPQGFHTFSVASESDESEGPAARASAAALGSQHHEVEVEAEDLATTIEDVAWHLDEPVADPAAFAVMKLCRYARQHVKVLLGGEGADELFAGYAGRYQSITSRNRRTNLLRRFRFLIPPGDLSHLQTRWQRACYRAHRTSAEEIVEARIEGLPGGGLEQWVFDAPQLHRLERRISEMSLQLLSSPGRPLDQAQSLDIRWQLAESLLQKSDKMSMAASLELRCPFLDCAVAAVAARIPAELRLRSCGAGKLALRAALQRKAGVSPEFPKKGFPLPLGDWLRGPLREAVASAIFSSTSVCLSHLNRRALEDAWKAFLGGSPLADVFYALWLYESWHVRCARQLSRPAA